MDSDFNTAKALGFLFGVINDIGTIIHKDDLLSKHIHTTLLDEFQNLDRFFNFILPEDEALSGSAQEWKEKFENVVNAILEFRKKNKEQKNYEIADAIRDILAECDIQVNDNRNEFTWELVDYP
jgi:cysteinyl-tRNA synthetase